jgi:hypothetical protein
MTPQVKRFLTTHVIASYACHALFIALADNRLGGFNGSIVTTVVAFLLAPLSFPIAIIVALVWPQNVKPHHYDLVVGYVLAVTFIYALGRVRFQSASTPQ